MLTRGDKMAGSQYMSVEKLIGRDNYSEWKFAMKALLELDDLWDVVSGTETDEKKDKKALSKIILSVDKINYSHIKSATKSKEAWTNLEKAFEDSGLTRRVGLLRSLINTKLEDCKSTEEYCDRIISTAHKLNEMNFKVENEWVGTLLLAGLPEEYRPMIMGLESSGTQISGDSIKVKLLQDVKTQQDPKSVDSNLAMFTKGNITKSNPKKNVKCYNCGKMGHFKTECRSKKKVDKKTSKNDSTAYAAFLTSENVKTDVWYLDSCASTHITGNRKWLNEATNIKAKVKTANSNDMIIEEKGTASIQVHIDGKQESIEVKEVMYAPEAAVNLLSIHKIVEKGHRVVFDRNGAKIFNRNNYLIARGFETNGIYQLNTVQSNRAYFCTQPEENLWHRRLGHLNLRSMNLLTKMSVGMDKDFKVSTTSCLSCIEGKQRKQPFQTSQTQSTRPLELIHSDLCGPMETISIGGSRYFLTFIDDYTRYVHIYFLAEKSQVIEAFKEFKNLVENKTDSKIKILRTDNGTEYVNKQMKLILTSSGIVHQTTVRYNPQQNGVSERANRTIVDKARTMLSEANLNKKYWAEAVNISVYLMNRSPTKAISGKTPYEAWYNRRPNLAHLRIFGCQAMAHVPDELRQKWDAKSERLIFVGYGENKKGYRLLNPNTNKVIYSRDVVFFEDKMEQLKSDEIKDESNTFLWKINQDTATIEENSVHEESEQDELETTDEQGGGSSTGEEEIVSSRGRRVNKPKYLQDFEIYATYDHLILSDDPQTYEKAIVDEEWRKSIEQELKSLEKLQTWSTCELPDGKVAIDTKWVFKTKEDGTKKARLVAKGFQIQEENPHNIYAPVTRMSTVRMLLAKSLQENWNLRQLDIPTAFLNGMLTSEVYIKTPKGLDIGKSKVLKLNRALYGLRESPRCWNNQFDKIMKDLDFQRSNFDFCMYCKKDCWLIVFVDDLIITGKDVEIEKTVKSLKSLLNAKDMGQVKRFLGMEITKTAEELKIIQRNYIEKLLSHFNMMECKGVSTPMVTGFNIDPSSAPDTESTNFPYRKLVGSLMYLACTSRPDIMYSVSYLSRYLDKPNKELVTAGKRILRYLKSTADKGLVYKKGPEKLEAYSDADWAGDRSDRKSTSGSLILYGGNPISWFSKKQTCVALSTAEAEYVAAAASAQELVNLKGVLSEFSEVKCATLKMDNLSAVSMAQTYENSKRAKHIDIKEHFIKDLTNKGIIKIEYVNTNDNFADILTKPLCKEKFVNICKLLNIIEY